VTYNLRMRPPPILLAALLAALSPSGRAAPAAPAPDPLEPLRFLEGRWEGTGKGEPGDSKVEWSFAFVLGGRYLELRGTSVYDPQPANPKGERHEELGLFSYDRLRARFVWRQFTVERFVNQYVMAAAADGALVFTTEAIENLPAGWRARETLRRDGPDRLTAVFEVAEPGKDFAVYAENRLVRRR
jgi:hypothetical protein